MTDVPDADATPEVVWQGRYIAAVRQGRWEYAARVRTVRAAAILAVHEGNLVLVEQHRVPLGRRSLELPAGLIGDEETGETVEAAAIRELEEETGFRAASVTVLGEFAASPGMTNETFLLVRAEGLERVSQGGGTAAEDITVHLVPQDEVAAFIGRRRAEGVSIEVKLLLLLAGEMLA